MRASTSHLWVPSEDYSPHSIMPRFLYRNEILQGAKRNLSGIKSASAHCRSSSSLLPVKRFSPAGRTVSSYRPCRNGDTSSFNSPLFSLNWAQLSVVMPTFPITRQRGKARAACIRNASSSRSNREGQPSTKNFKPTHGADRHLVRK